MAVAEGRAGIAAVLIVEHLAEFADVELLEVVLAAAISASDRVAVDVILAAVARSASVASQRDELDEVERGAGLAQLELARLSQDVSELLGRTIDLRTMYPERR